MEQAFSELRDQQIKEAVERNIMAVLKISTGQA